MLLTECSSILKNSRLFIDIISDELSPTVTILRLIFSMNWQVVAFFNCIQLQIDDFLDLLDLLFANSRYQEH
jgi:hypothetical protein